MWLGVRSDRRNKPRVIMAVPTMGNTRYLPVRDTIWPPPIEVMSKPAISGQDLEAGGGRRCALHQLESKGGGK